MGDSWEKISPDLTTNDPAKQNQIESGGLSTDNSGAENHCTIFTIAESTLDQQVIWAGTDDGNVQVTQDEGKTWTNTTPNISGLPANTWCYHIEASVHNKGTAYAVFDGHTSNDMTPYVYKTSDFGATWTALATDDIVGFARNIQEDYVNPDLLFLGTELGLFITIDGGKNWSRFTNNMPATAVHFIDLQKQTSDLVLGTHGRGIIIIDDISPLRGITQEVLAENVHFFDTKPTVIVEESGFGGASTEMQFVGPNPTRSAKIIYYLKKRHIFGKMLMEIRDMEGNKLIELTPGKSKGINVVTWNYRVKQPKMAKGKTFTFGGFTAPRVTAGTYQVIMTKGKETYKTQIELIDDPTSVLTAAERTALANTTDKLYNMCEELAYLVYQIDQHTAKAEELKSQASYRRSAQPVIDELTSLKEGLVITTGDNYVGAAEPQLREKLATLYSKVASGFNPPSASEMQNLKLLENQFVEAKATFEKIKAKRIKKLANLIVKNELPETEIKAFEEFLEE